MKIANHQQSGSKIDARLSPIIYTDPVGEAATTLYLELSNSVIRICHLLDTGARDARASDAGILFLYLLARSVQILRSIRILVNNDEVSSVLTLARGLYEVFGRLLFVNRKPELAQSLVLAGYVDGERFEFGRNKAGSIDRRKVRECSTGKEYRCDYSLTEIFRLCEADRDAAIHRDLYYVLSAEVHPTADLLSEFVVRRGFLLHRAHDTLYTMYILGYLTFLLWREIAVFPLISRRDRRDAKHALNVVREALLAVIAPLKPVVEKGGEGDRFKPLFMGIYQVVMEPYGDNYWLALDDEECGGGDSEGAVL